MKTMEHQIEKLFCDSLDADELKSAIASFERHNELTDVEVFVKKFSNNQFIVETNDYFYKGYKSQKTLDHLVRVILSRLYVDLGITWELFSEQSHGFYFDLSRRQKLQVCRPTDEPFENILLSFSSILETVEGELDLGNLLMQLKKQESFNDVCQLKLTRAEKNKHEDYAFFNSQVVLLDDSDFCLVPLNEKSEPLEVLPRNKIEVELNKKNMLFSPLDSLGINFDESASNSASEAPARHQIYKGWELYEGVPSPIDADLPSQKHLTSDLCHSKNAKAMLDSKMSPECSPAQSLKQRVELVMKAGIKPHKRKEFAYYEETLAADVSPTVLEFQLTNSSESLFWSKIAATQEENKNVWVVTPMVLRDIEGGSCEEYVNWSSHMKTLDTYFPEVNKVATAFLNKKMCEFYLRGGFDVGGFASIFNCAVGFIPPLGPETYPSRNLFRKFLVGFARKNGDIFDFCFFKHRQITNVLSKEMSDGKCNRRKENRRSLCEHDDFWTCYADSDLCMMCDIEQVYNSVVLKNRSLGNFL